MPYEDRFKFVNEKCFDKNNPSVPRLTHFIRRDHLFDHLSFVLRSHSLFYCSVPKVATRTLLSFITYLHIRDELMTASTNNSTSYFNSNSNLYNENFLNQILSQSLRVNI